MRAVASEEQLRRIHYQNYAAVSSGLKQAERATRNAIRVGAEDSIAPLTLNLMMLVAIKAESRLMKLLFLPDGFSDAERTEILGRSRVLDQWSAAVDLGYRRKFRIAVGVPVLSRLGHDDSARYTTIRRVLDEQLRPIIEIRNKLAHGQWARPLNADNTAVATDACEFIARENPMLLGLRDAALEAIANIVGDLIQSAGLYRSRFDVHYKVIQKVERNKDKNYAAWKGSLRNRHLAGVQRQVDNIEQARAAITRGQSA